jgi:hypothetical protein
VQPWLQELARQPVETSQPALKTNRCRVHCIEAITAGTGLSEMVAVIEGSPLSCRRPLPPLGHRESERSAPPRTTLCSPT